MFKNLTDLPLKVLDIIPDLIAQNPDPALKGDLLLQECLFDGGFGVLGNEVRDDVEDLEGEVSQVLEHHGALESGLRRLAIIHIGFAHILGRNILGLVLTGTKSHTGKGKGDFVVLHLAIYSVAVIVLSMMSN